MTKLYVASIVDGTPTSSASQSFLQNPYYFMFASLAKPDEDVELHWLKVRVFFSEATVAPDLRSPPAGWEDALYNRLRGFITVPLERRRGRRVRCGVLCLPRSERAHGGQLSTEAELIRGRWVSDILHLLCFFFRDSA